MLKQKQVKFLNHASLTDLTSSALNTPEFSYVTGENAFYTKIGGVNTLIGSGKFWGLKGNAGTNPATDFIGTTDDKDIIFKRNNLQIGTLNTNKVIWGINNFNLASTTGNDFYLGAGKGNFYANTTGYNLAVGAGVQNYFSNTTGNNNTGGGGIDNFLKNTTGSYNSFGAGIQNFYSNTTGSYNVATGYNNFYYSTTGSNNVTTGNFNFPRLGTGSSYNVAIGNNLFSNSITSTANIGLGRFNLVNIVTGINNVALGNYVETTVTTTVVTNTPSSNFTITAVTGGVQISGTDIATVITQSGGTVGSYSLIMNVIGYNTYPVQIVNSNTVFRPNTTVADFTGRNITITIPNEVSNTVGIGTNVIINKSNQVVLGGTNTSEVKFRGESGYNYAHDVSSILGSGDDGKVWTYEHSSQSIKMKVPKKTYTLQMRGQNGTAFDFVDGIPIPDDMIGGVVKEVKIMRNDLSSGGTATVTGQIRIVSSPNATTWTQSYSIASAANGSNIVTYNPNTTLVSTMKSFELTSNTASNQAVTVTIIIEK